MQKSGTNDTTMNCEVTLYISNQYVRFTGYNTLNPDKIGLCKTTPLKFGTRDARSTVGPLPTD